MPEINVWVHKSCFSHSSEIVKCFFKQVINEQKVKNEFCIAIFIGVV